MRYKFKNRIPGEDLRKIRGFRLNPPQSIVGLAESIGVGVIEVDLKDGQLAYLEERRELGTPTGYVIFVHKDLPINEKRWAVAHELGHYFLHRDRREGTFDTQVHLQRDKLQYWLLENEEEEADRFAEDIFFDEGALEAFVSLHGADSRLLATKVFGVPEHRVESAIRFRSTYRGMRTART